MIRQLAKTHKMGLSDPWFDYVRQEKNQWGKYMMIVEKDIM